MSRGANRPLDYNAVEMFSKFRKSTQCIVNLQLCLNKKGKPSWQKNQIERSFWSSYVILYIDQFKVGQYLRICNGGGFEILSNFQGTGHLVN